MSSTDQTLAPPRATSPRRRGAVVLEEDVATRRALRALLESGGDVSVVAEAADSATMLAVARQKQPDLILIGSSVDGDDAARAMATLAELAPGCRAVVLAGRSDVDYAREMLRAGAA